MFPDLQSLDCFAPPPPLLLLCQYAAPLRHGSLVSPDPLLLYITCYDLGPRASCYSQSLTPQSDLISESRIGQFNLMYLVQYAICPLQYLC